jgi:hypothetical protein
MTFLKRRATVTMTTTTTGITTALSTAATPARSGNNDNDDGNRNNQNDAVNTVVSVDLMPGAQVFGLCMQVQKKNISITGYGAW